MRLNILILYDQSTVHINTVRDHLDSFRLYSRHNVSYANAVGQTPLRVPLSMFDVVIVHYSVRLAFDWHISPEFAWMLRQFTGLKALLIQDEYDNTWRACHWINLLGIRVVFTCVPARYVPQIYSKVDHTSVEFFQVLTGYLPLHIDYDKKNRPLSERSIVIGYRGRPLAFRYGLLAREKWVIGQRMRQECEARGIRHDIEWAENRRIYGDAWVDFVASCRATLGTESGSNIFDFDGTLAPKISAELERNPTLTFEEVYEKHLKGLETEPIMNQVSPRIFEAVALRTALILFEGEYSGVLRPHEHYIPLKKDFSNVEEVLSRVQDDAAVAGMVERAYRHVIASGLYTYQKFVADCDEVLSARVRTASKHQLVTRAVASAEPEGPLCNLTSTSFYSHPIDATKLYPAAPRRGLRAVLGWCRRTAKQFVLRFLPFVIVLIKGLRRARMSYHFVVDDPKMKATWRQGASSPAVRQVIGKLGFFKELIKLRVLKWCFQQCPAIASPYWVKPCLQPAEKRLVFTSVLVAEEFPASFTAPIPWDEIEEAFRSGKITTVAWDHSRVAPKVYIPVDSEIGYEFYLGPEAVYTFRGVSALAQEDLPAVIALLKDVAGTREPATERAGELPGCRPSSREAA
jgi:hypothetical protein